MKVIFIGILISMNIYISFDNKKEIMYEIKIKSNHVNMNFDTHKIQFYEIVSDIYNNIKDGGGVVKTSIGNHDVFYAWCFYECEVYNLYSEKKFNDVSIKIDRVNRNNANYFSYKNMVSSMKNSCELHIYYNSYNIISLISYLSDITMKRGYPVSSIWYDRSKANEGYDITIDMYDECNNFNLYKETYILEVENYINITK